MDIFVKISIEIYLIFFLYFNFLYLCEIKILFVDILILVYNQFD